MSSISYTERFTHPTTADVEAVLNWQHCDQCLRWSNRTLAWRNYPNTPQGRTVLDAIGRHFIVNGIGKDKFDRREGITLDELDALVSARTPKESPYQAHYVDGRRMPGRKAQ